MNSQLLAQTTSKKPSACRDYPIDITPRDELVPPMMPDLQLLLLTQSRISLMRESGNLFKSPICRNDGSSIRPSVDGVKMSSKHHQVLGYKLPMILETKPALLFQGLTLTRIKL